MGIPILSALSVKDRMLIKLKGNVKPQLQTQWPHSNPRIKMLCLKSCLTQTVMSCPTLNNRPIWCNDLFGRQRSCVPRIPVGKLYGCSFDSICHPNWSATNWEGESVFLKFAGVREGMEFAERDNVTVRFTRVHNSPLWISFKERVKLEWNNFPLV